MRLMERPLAARSPLLCGARYVLPRLISGRADRGDHSSVTTRNVCASIQSPPFFDAAHVPPRSAALSASITALECAIEANRISSVSNVDS